MNYSDEFFSTLFVLRGLSTIFNSQHYGWTHQLPENLVVFNTCKIEILAYLLRILWAGYSNQEGA